MALLAPKTFFLDHFSLKSKQGCKTVPIVMVLITTALLNGCSQQTDDETDTDPAAVAREACTALTGTAWVPNVANVADTNHDTTVTVTSETLTTSGPIIGLEQAPSADKQISATFTVPEDLGEGGSITLVADVTGFPTNLSGTAYPLLVSLSDGTNDLVGVSCTGTETSSGSSGFYACPVSETEPCEVNSTVCGISATSGYTDFSDWLQHQIPVWGYTSVNTMPTCNWASGTPSCAFNSTFFVDGKLRSGVTYTAKYVLLSNQIASDLSGYDANITIKVIQKKDATLAGGTFDINVFLVGNDIINDSRTDKGKYNLDVLFTEVKNHYEQTGSNVKVGKINAIEWNCDLNGDTYAEPDIDDTFDDLLGIGSALATEGTEGKAVNLFIVSKVKSTSLGDNVTILGISGGIGGPPLNSRATSGLAFGVEYDDHALSNYNSACVDLTAVASCPIASQEVDFQELAITISHEMGHYLGLNHPSESDASQNDRIPDTPVCTRKQSGSITNSSCSRDVNIFESTGLSCAEACPDYDGSTVFCPAAVECQFNQIMWWTSKKHDATTGEGDGNLFSTQSGTVINYSSFIQ